MENKVIVGRCAKMPVEFNPLSFNENPNHDELGRFAEGPGGVGEKGAMQKMKDASEHATETGRAAVKAGTASAHAAASAAHARAAAAARAAGQDKLADMHNSLAKQHAAAADSGPARRKEDSQDSDLKTIAGVKGGNSWDESKSEPIPPQSQEDTHRPMPGPGNRDMFGKRVPKIGTAAYSRLARKTNGY